MTSKRTAATSANRAPGAFGQYIAIARLDHWTKNLFVVPGIFLALVFTRGSLQKHGPAVFMALMATCLISSANYALNEWLDRKFDRFHPVKRKRPSVGGTITSGGVTIEYALLAIGGLALAAGVNQRVFESCLALLLTGIFYNVQPFRTKDRAYLDVVSESINNPIRLCIGWFAISQAQFPPSSLILGYWFGGAFLMAIKRFAEFRAIDDRVVAAQYRRSFGRYSEESLLGSAVFHAMAASLFLGVFLVKHRIELILTFPFLALLFAWYVRIGYDDDSAAQHPERLFSQRKFMLFVLLLALLMAALFLVDIPVLHRLLRNTFSEL